MDICSYQRWGCENHWEASETWDGEGSLESVQVKLANLPNSERGWGEFTHF